MASTVPADIDTHGDTAPAYSGKDRAKKTMAEGEAPASSGEGSPPSFAQDDGAEINYRNLEWW